MRLQQLTNQLIRAEGTEGMPQFVYREMVQYLALSSGHQRLKVDQEDLEWPLLLVAQELQTLLKNRGIQWEVPLFEKIVSPEHPLKLMIPLPLNVTWGDYETAIKKSLKRRRDSWVVQIRFERLTEGNCVQLLHRGSHAGIGDSIRAMKQFAADHDCRLAVAHHEIYLNDVEETPARDLQTLLLIRVK